ncbi:uncharacterized protein MELLADRAFT_76372 [Melampsora larici-populina 98AG31]|uniref:Uncharacterized protein n=1 Tax=Melampsora larici-populina (strain 98AG31 / pathotype 3-4-7) TaxID=747676 RepID=F4R4L2_MELLP|nr:uncharacterized protein MELLADRAFT_76372 [Melampsora larici-populina 98AG31]EGG12979.1 hypothetical protein MELLADRAFT_76372 [Melampsora larici-populina 98AG31]
MSYRSSPRMHVLKQKFQVPIIDYLDLILAENPQSFYNHFLKKELIISYF